MRGILLTLAIIGVQAAAAGTVVDLGYAKYRGNLSLLLNTVAFLGSPYAEPPLVQQRFRFPAPLDVSRVTHSSYDSIIDATSYPAFCVQGTTGAFAFTLALSAVVGLIVVLQRPYLAVQAAKTV